MQRVGKCLRAIVMVFLLAPLGVLPTADAWHATDTDLPDDPPNAPSQVWDDTGMVFVDRPMHDVEDRIADANGVVNASYRMIKGTIDESRDEAVNDVPRAPVELFRDGAGGFAAENKLDARAGGFGDWKVIGAPVWDHLPSAARHGDYGYTQATEAGGVYAPGARSLLVSPEIDLDTNVFATNSETMRSLARELGQPESSANMVEDTVPTSSVLSAVIDACHLAQRLPCETYGELFGDPLYSFTYSLRYNLARQGLGDAGIDGVSVLVFTQEPKSLLDAEGCLPEPPREPLLVDVACSVAKPSSGYPASEIEAMPEYGEIEFESIPFFVPAEDLTGVNRDGAYAGYSGQSGGWVTDKINLGPWNGRSVWIGFLSSSTNFPSSTYFGSTSRFDTSADHFGFHLDDLRVQAPASPFNLKARQADMPADIPDVESYRQAGIPTIPPNLPFEARGQVVNVGSLTVEVGAALRVLRQDSTTGVLTQVYDADGNPYEYVVPEPQPVGPGDALEMSVWFQNLGTGVDYVVQICANRFGDGNMAGDAEFCEEPPAEGECSEDPWDADVCDEVTLHRFNVEPVIDWSIGHVTRETDRIQVGDSTVMGLSFRNNGNLEQVLDVAPRIITLTGDGANDDDQRMLLRADSNPEQLHPRTIVLKPGSITELSWDVRGVAEGGYLLMVDVVGNGTGQVPFHVRDVFPEMVRPWRSWPVAEGIAIDGIADDPLWHNNTAIGLLPGESRYRFANTARTENPSLYMLFEEISSPRLEVFFADTTPEAPDLRSGAATGYVVTEDGLETLVYDDDALGWLPGGPITTIADGQRTSAGDSFTYELKVPIAVKGQEAGLAAGPGQTVPVLVRMCDETGSICRHLPDEAPWQDGGGILPKDGSLADEIELWHVLVLSAREPSQPIFERIVGGGLGVNSRPPAFLEADFTDCRTSTVLGWVPMIADYDGPKDKWNCGPYPGFGHRTMLYQGVSPDDAGPNGDCRGECWPYAMAPGYRQLITRPFVIPPDAQEPTVTLAHQYATDLLIDDNHHLVYPENNPMLWVEIWDEATEEFDEFYFLRPEGGYTSESEAGIHDPRFSRQFRVPNTLSDEAESPGWWWPQGDFPLFQKPSEDLPHGESFSGSSPWFTDIIPLYGDHFGQSLKLQGKTVRLSFDHPFHVHPEVHDVSLSGRVSSHTNGGQRVTSPEADFLKSDAAFRGGAERPFTAVCRTQDGSTYGGHIYLLTTAPAGCSGVAQFFDIILPAPMDATGYVKAKNVWRSVQYHDQFDESGEGGTLPAEVPIQGAAYEELGSGAVFDWVDANGNGRFDGADSLFVNVGGSEAVEARDIRLRGGEPVGATYCGTTRCNSTAATAVARDLVYVDWSGDGAWSAQSFDFIKDPCSTQQPGPCRKENDESTDMLLLPARVLNGDTTNVDPERDWGWRIGSVSVTEGPSFRSDVALPLAELNVPWDAHQRGIGPDTTVPVTVTLQNRGLLGQTVYVEVIGQDVGSGEQVCTDRSPNLNVPEGSERVMVLGCYVPEAYEFGRLAFRAEVILVGTSTDEIPGNNVQRVPGFFDVTSHPEALIKTAVTPSADSEGVPRQIAITVENLGNVPLPDVEAEIQIERSTHDGPVPVVEPITVNLNDPLPTSGRLLISPRNSDAHASDLRFTPQVPGFYLVKTRLHVPDDRNLDNDFSTVQVKAQQVLYREAADGDEPLIVDGIIEGNLEFDDERVWSRQANSVDGSGRFLAGDPNRADIPAGTDASIRLPSIDLEAVKDATLSFKHRFNLEDQFDAARAEVSLDGGTTWSPIKPKPQPGLPGGYSSEPILGVNGILGRNFECSNCAYTGDSSALPQSVDGWVTSEFDLTAQPQFTINTTIAAFNLDGLAPRPAPTSIVRAENDAAPSSVQWTHLDAARDEAGAPYWALDDLGWFENQQYWWIDNRTYSEPAPRSGEKMWWSGTAGTPDSSGNLPAVGTRLSLPLDPAYWAETEDPEEVVVSWWEWRAGWRTTNREGTGATFSVVGPQGVETRLAEMLPSGWTRREMVLPENPGPGAIMFSYYSGESDKAPVYDGGPHADRFKRLDGERYIHAEAKFKNNRGWFIGGAQVLAYGLPDPDSGVRPVEVLQEFQDLDALDGDNMGGWAAEVVPGNDPAIKWSLVHRGASQTASGWSLDTVEVPGKGPTTAWSFSSDEYAEGYLPNADSVVVTPMVDLRNYHGDRAFFRFDHKFGLKGTETHNHGGYNPETGQWSDFATTDGRHMGEAGDGGTVIYQEYDADTDTYGAWTPLTGSEKILSHPFLSSSTYWQEAQVNLDAMGYPAVSRQFGSALEQVTNAYSGGGGNTFPSNPWKPYPYAPAFSGDSSRLAAEGMDGWLEAEWDISHLIGTEVRFGFHVWTDPSNDMCNTEWSQDSVPRFFGDDTAPDHHMPNQCPGAYDERVHDAPSWVSHWKSHSVLPAPRGGWKIANPAVIGEAFNGVPAALRLRVATDSSFTNGEWSVDDISVVGTRYQEQIVFKTDAPHRLAEPGTRLVFNATMANLGVGPRTNLALHAAAYFQDAAGSLPVDVLDLRVPAIDAWLLPQDAAGAIGPISLDAGGEPGDESPFRIALNLPEGRWDLNIVVRLLEQPCAGCEYVFVRNEEGGPAEARWSVHVEDLLAFGFVPPVENRTGPIVPTKTFLKGGDTATFLTAIENQGIAEPDADITWVLKEILRKGDPETQEGLQEKREEVVGTFSQSIGVLRRGEVRDAHASFALERDGLYEVTVRVETQDGEGFSETLEFFVGEPSPYFRTDFSESAASNGGWTDISPELGSQGGGSPEEVRFRQVGDQYVWGVSRQDFAASRDYCSFGGCNSPSTRTQPPVYGLNGEATSRNLVDLGRVPQDRASLTLKHTHRFNELDGARLEVMPVKMPIASEASPTPAFWCVAGNNRVPLWFAPQMVDPSQADATILSLNGYTNPGGNPPPPDKNVPQRVNPLNERASQNERATTRTTDEIVSRIPAFGGPSVEHEVVEYVLDAPPTPFCPPGFQPEFLFLDNDIEPPETLINYTVKLRLRTGTLPGLTWQCEERDNIPDPRGRTQGSQSYCIHNGKEGPGRGRTGSLGWQIDSISVNSVDVEVVPEHRTLPILDGYDKTYSFLARNNGTVPEVFRIEHDPERSSPGLDASWFQFDAPEIPLAPGETRQVVFAVTVPQEPAPPRGTYRATFDVVAVHDPSRRASIGLDLVLEDQPLPDLTVQIATDKQTVIPKVEQDTTATVYLTVNNVGFKDSDPVPIRTSLERNASQAPIDERVVGRLCPAVECGDAEGASQKTLTFEWLVPHELGFYTLRTEVDPEGRLVETSKAQNNQSLLVQVVPLQRPDLSLTNLELVGIGEDGYATEGGLVKIVANVTNVGVAPATEVQVLIMSGAAKLADVTLDSVLPEQTRQVTAARIASRGESLIRAVVVPTGNETDADNNEFTKLLRVRGIDVNVTREDPGVLEMQPGEDASFRVTIGNEGNVAETVALRLGETESGWAMAASPNPVRVAPNSTGWTFLTLQTPPDAKAGMTNLTVIASPQSRPSHETALTIPISVAKTDGSPEMHIEENSNQSRELVVRLASQQNAAEQLEIIVVEPPGWGTPNTFIKLGPREDSSIRLPLQIPARSPPGPTDVTVHAKTPDGVLRAAATGTVVVPPVINGTAIWAGGSWVEDAEEPSSQTFAFRLNVTNEGNVAFNASAQAHRLHNASRQAEDNATVAVPVGRTVALPLNVEVDAAFIEEIRGDTLVWAYGDNRSQAQLLAELKIPSLTMPDLEATRVRISPATGIRVGDSVGVAATVSNLGIVGSPATDMDAYVNGELVNSYAIPALAPNEEATVNMTWMFRHPGEHLIYVQGNAARSVEELYVDNNAKTVVVEVEQRPADRAVDRVSELPAPTVPYFLTALVIGFLFLRRVREVR